MKIADACTSHAPTVTEKAGKAMGNYVFITLAASVRSAAQHTSISLNLLNKIYLDLTKKLEIINLCS